MKNPRAICVPKELDGLRFLQDRTPTTSQEKSAEAFAKLADYRDGAIFIGHYAGNSEWEKHSRGDEIVYVLGGQTTVFLFSDGSESAQQLSEGELMIVPEDTWHRFETPIGVKILTITPLPTDHSVEHPAG